MNSNFYQIYTRIKTYPIIGGIIVLLHDFFYPFLQRRRLQRADRLRAKEILSDLFGSNHWIHRDLDIFRAGPYFFNEFTHGQSGDFDVMMLYALVRVTAPDIVVETGVASGRSSTAVLAAMEKNSKGRLYSVDLPHFFNTSLPGYQITSEGNAELLGYIPEGKEPGWLVPNHLRNRWELTLGDSKKILPIVLKRLSKIDIFYHDSEHTREAMLREFQSVWPLIPEGGFFLSDDIDWNTAWKEFTSEKKPQYIAAYRHLGVAQK